MSEELPDLKEFDRFRLISKIGEGGMGTVYLAEDGGLGRHVAIKFLSLESGGDVERINRFIREAKAASALNHPNILTIYEIGELEESPYIVSEFIDGSTLRDLARDQHQTLDQKLEIALQIAGALSAAHDAGIIHRDIKPENIMIRRDGLVKVLDFGLAKLTSEHSDKDLRPSSQVSTHRHVNTAPGVLLGTVAYMSPEQARGLNLDPRSDVFSFGVVLFELFTDRRPFQGESQADLISAILKDDAPSIKDFAPSLPRELERIVSKSLRKDRDHRYQTVKDLCIDLEDLRDEIRYDLRASQTIVSPEPVPTSERAHSTFTTGFTSTPRFTLLHVVILGTVALSLVVGAWLYFRNRTAADAVPGSFRSLEVASWASVPGELGNTASFSPDGKLIAFSSTRSGTKNIWVTQTASTDAIQVINDGNENVNPIFSPDGAEIAYYSERRNADGPTALEIRRVPSLGGTPKPIGQVVGRSVELRLWTSTGRIYYQSGANLFVMEIATGASRPVTSFSEPANVLPWVSISPDEGFVAFLRTDGKAWSMYIGDGTGSDAKAVANGTGQTSAVVWLANRGRVFFTAKVDDVNQVFVQDIGSPPRRITNAETDVFVASASQDGSSLLTITNREQSNIWLANTKDGNESSVASDLNVEFWPTVSPDGQRVAYLSARSLSGGANLLNHPVVVKSITAGDSERPMTIAEEAFVPAFSPDGSHIAFLRYSPDTTELIAVSSTGGGERRLAEGVQLPAYTTSPYNLVQTAAFSWSPDGRSIAYASKKNGAANVWLARVTGGDEPLTANADATYNAFSPLWSPGGSHIAYLTQRKDPADTSKTLRRITVLDVGSKAPSDVFETSKVIRLLGWDGESLIIAETAKLDGVPQPVVLKRVDLANGAPRDIARLENAYFFNIALSADSRFVSYVARVQDRDDLWIAGLSGGAPRRLTKNNDATVYFSRLAWLRDGSAIAFAKQVRFTLLSRVTDIN